MKILRWLVAAHLAAMSFWMNAFASEVTHVNAKPVATNVMSKLNSSGETDAIVVLRSPSLVTTEPDSMGPGKRSVQINAYARLKARKTAVTATKDMLKADPVLADLEELTTYQYLPVMHVRIRSAAELYALTANQNVEGVYENAPVQLNLASSLPSIGQPTPPPEGWGGRGTAVAVIDTGVDLANPVFGDCSGGAGAPGCAVAVADGMDGFITSGDSHGTQVTAVILGVAPETKILSFNAWRRINLSSTEALVYGMNKVLEWSPHFNIVAVNLSASTGPVQTGFCLLGPFHTVFRALREEGIVPIVSSGNDSGYGLREPACDPEAVSVGATDDFGQASSFSNFVDWMSLAAPGYQITAAGFTSSGTSVAAAHVTGAIASVWPKFSGDSVNGVVNRLQRTGTRTLFDRYYDGDVRRISLSAVRAQFPDPNPDPFSFGVRQDVPRSTFISSELVQVSGINVSAPVSVVGGTVSINGGPFTATPGPIAAGQTIQAGVESSGRYNTETSVLVTVGGTSARFTVDTLQVEPWVVAPIIMNILH